MRTQIDTTHLNNIIKGWNEGKTIERNLRRINTHFLEDDGNKCAIGALLPDSLCKEIMDSRFGTTNIYGIASWQDRSGESSLLAALANKVMKELDGVNISMLADLQEVHDRYYQKGIATIKARLRYIAKRYKLTAPAPYPNEEVVTIEED